MFPQLFRVLPNLHKCFYNSIETQRKCFLFLLENSARKITKNEENLIVFFIIKTYILYTPQCTRHLNLNFFVFLSSYRNTIINQSAHVFSLSYFLNKYKVIYYFQADFNHGFTHGFTTSMRSKFLMTVISLICSDKSLTLKNISFLKSSYSDNLTIINYFHTIYQILEFNYFLTKAASQ